MKTAKSRSVLMKYFIKHKPLISEECQIHSCSENECVRIFFLLLFFLPEIFPWLKKSYYCWSLLMHVHGSFFPLKGA